MVDFFKTVPDGINVLIIKLFFLAFLCSDFIEGNQLPDVNKRVKHVILTVHVSQKDLNDIVSSTA